MHPRESNPDFATLFKTCRKRLGMKQIPFAEFLGCSQSRISKIEKGKQEPGARDLWRLVDQVTGLDLKEEFEVAFTPLTDAP